MHSLNTIPNTHPELSTRVRLVTPYAGACPHSGEPQPGSTMTLIYTPAALLIELHAVEQYLARFAEGDAIDLETVVQETARDAAAAVGVPVTVIGRFHLRRGLEMVVTCRA